MAVIPLDLGEGNGTRQEQLALPSQRTIEAATRSLARLGTVRGRFGLLECLDDDRRQFVGGI
jgi:hypothetical protein